MSNILFVNNRSTFTVTKEGIDVQRRVADSDDRSNLSLLKARVVDTTLHDKNNTGVVALDLNAEGDLVVAGSLKTNGEISMSNVTLTSTSSSNHAVHLTLPSVSGELATTDTATTTKAGLMSPADKAYLNALNAAGVLNTVRNDDDDATSSGDQVVANSRFHGVVDFTGATSVIGLTKVSVGLSNIDDTSDLDKPVSRAMKDALDNLQTAVDSLAPLDSPVFPEGLALANSSYLQFGQDSDTSSYRVSKVGSGDTANLQLQKKTTLGANWTNVLNLDSIPARLDALAPLQDPVFTGQMTLQSKGSGGDLTLQLGPGESSTTASTYRFRKTTGDLFLEKSDGSTGSYTTVVDFGNIGVGVDQTHLAPIESPQFRGGVTILGKTGDCNIQFGPTNGQPTRSFRIKRYDTEGRLVFQTNTGTGWKDLHDLDKILSDDSHLATREAPRFTGDVVLDSGNLEMKTQDSVHIQLGRGPGDTSNSSYRLTRPTGTGLVLQRTSGGGDWVDLFNMENLHSTADGLATREAPVFTKGVEVSTGGLRITDDTSPVALQLGSGGENSSTFRILKSPGIQGSLVLEKKRISDNGSPWEPVFDFEKVKVDTSVFALKTGGDFTGSIGVTHGNLLLKDPDRDIALQLGPGDNSGNSFRFLKEGPETAGRLLLQKTTDGNDWRDILDMETLDTSVFAPVTAPVFQGGSRVATGDFRVDLGSVALESSEEVSLRLGPNPDPNDFSPAFRFLKTSGSNASLLLQKSDSTGFQTVVDMDNVASNDQIQALQETIQAQQVLIDSLTTRLEALEAAKENQ